MNELAVALKIALSNSFVMYTKAHSYHWNVEGMFFSQFHEFFGDIYAEVYNAVDPLAEEMRALGVYAPISLADMLSATTVTEDQFKVNGVKDMLVNLQQANDQVLESLVKAADLANNQNLQGLLNFLADRIDQHKKHAWMIRASLQVGA